MLLKTQLHTHINIYQCQADIFILKYKHFKIIKKFKLQILQY